MGEAQGVPAVAVMTLNFISAAQLMARVLGLPGYRFCVIDHPISSAGEKQLLAEAESTLELIEKIALDTASQHAKR